MTLNVERHKNLLKVTDGNAPGSIAIVRLYGDAVIQRAEDIARALEQLLSLKELNTFQHKVQGIVRTYRPIGYVGGADVAIVVLTDIVVPADAQNKNASGKFKKLEYVSSTTGMILYKKDGDDRNLPKTGAIVGRNTRVFLSGSVLTIEDRSSRWESGRWIGVIALAAFFIVVAIFLICRHGTCPLGPSTPPETETATSASTATTTLTPSATATRAMPKPTVDTPTSTVRNDPIPAPTATRKKITFFTAAPIPTTNFIPTTGPVQNASVDESSELEPVAIEFSVIEPEDNANSDGEEKFAWTTNYNLKPNERYEVVFFDIEENPVSDLNLGFGIYAPVGTTEVAVPLDEIDNDPGNPLEPGRYRWGVMLVKMDPQYERLQYLGGDRQFEYKRASTPECTPQYFWGGKSCD